MAKVLKTLITHCKDCPFKEATPYPTSDSWERAEYWWCKHPNNEDVMDESGRGEEERQRLKKTGAPFNIRYIDGYVEWRDEKNITPPDWCKLENE